MTMMMAKKVCVIFYFFLIFCKTILNYDVKYPLNNILVKATLILVKAL